VDLASNSRDARPPRQIVRPNIDDDGCQAQHNADPERRRMMNSPPIASGPVLIVIFAVHQCLSADRFVSGIWLIEKVVINTTSGQDVQRAESE
jgi:hypothetical protein